MIGSPQTLSFSRSQSFSAKVICTATETITIGVKEKNLRSVIQVADTNLVAESPTQTFLLHFEVSSWML